MHQTEDRDADLKKKIRSPCSVGLVEEIIAGDTTHNTRVDMLLNVSFTVLISTSELKTIFHHLLYVHRFPLWCL